MKITVDDATTLARVLERYAIYADRFMGSGFGSHPENLRNPKLFVETAEDIALITKLYPAFSSGKTLEQGVRERIELTTMPDPVRVRKDKIHPPDGGRSLLDQYPGTEP